MEGSFGSQECKQAVVIFTDRVHARIDWPKVSESFKKETSMFTG
jgi:hypothetical protein